VHGEKQTQAKACQGGTATGLQARPGGPVPAPSCSQSLPALLSWAWFVWHQPGDSQQPNARREAPLYFLKYHLFANYREHIAVKKSSVTKASSIFQKSRSTPAHK